MCVRVFYVCVDKPTTGKNYELIIYFGVAEALKKSEQKKNERKNFSRLLFHVIVVALHFCRLTCGVIVAVVIAPHIIHEFSENVLAR